MKQTLLQVGDKVRIREDIRENVYYKMKSYNYSNCYPGTPPSAAVSSLPSTSRYRSGKSLLPNFLSSHIAQLPDRKPLRFPHLLTQPGKGLPCHLQRLPRRE